MKAFNMTAPKDPRLGRFYGWRESLAGMSETRQRFEEWVFLNAAGVLLSDKTGELLTLTYDEFDLELSAVESSLNSLAVQWDFSFSLLNEGENSLKLIIYRTDRLQAVLDEAPYCVMGAKLNYSYPLRAGTFIDEVRDRWGLHGHVPHEIGIALGYPLDDVFGYMGLLPLPCKGACGWQVYGCMKESQRRSCAFSNARCQALVILAGAAARA